MNRFFRLSPVLRARKAQEDAAKGAVIQSRAQIREAQALVRRKQLDLVGAEAPTEGTAHRMVEDAEEIERERMAVLADAAKRRRAVEMMAERHAEMVRANDLRRDQANLDELAMTSKARNAARSGGTE